MEASILFGLFALFVIIGVPIGFAIGMATSISLFFFAKDVPLIMVAQSSVTGVDSFPLMAIPFFILAGNLMSTGGVAKRLVNFASLFVGHITGGLGLVTTITCMFFAAISGSAVATTSAIGSFMVPEMELKGYDRRYSASLTACAGAIGVIIPPSIPFVIYGVVTKTSISDLFIAGIVPGVLMGVGLMITNYILSIKYGYKGYAKLASPKQMLLGFVDAFWALLAPVIVLGGIYGGFFTPTEASVVAVVYSLVVGVFIYKELDLKGIYKALKDSMVINGITTFMVGLSMAFATYLSLQNIPQTIANMLLNITDNRILLFLIINLFLLVLGCLVDNIPATIILAPILLPIVTKLGMSPITLGIMITFNLAIGFVTPPYGINLFVASAVANVTMESMVKYLKWFILSLIITLMIVTFVPQITEGMVVLIKSMGK